LLGSLSCCLSGFFDTFFATGRAHVADNAGLRFGASLIFGFAVGGL
jgi:hypothetical protein